MSNEWGETGTTEQTARGIYRVGFLPSSPLIFPFLPFSPLLLSLPPSLSASHLLAVCMLVCWFLGEYNFILQKQQSPACDSALSLKYYIYNITSLKLCNVSYLQKIACLIVNGNCAIWFWKAFGWAAGAAACLPPSRSSAALRWPVVSLVCDISAFCFYVLYA